MNHIGIKFDDVDTSESNVYLRERLVIPTPTQDVESIDIRGHHGSLTKKYAFSDIHLPIHFYFYENLSFKKAFREFKMVLFNSKTLISNDDDSVFYKIKSMVIEDALNEVLKLGEFTVNFTLDPFQYEISNQIEAYTSDTIINNLGYHADPVITAHLNGDGKIYINDQEIKITGISSTITIDSEMQNAYRVANGSTENLNDHMIGDFPVLEHGKNNISFDGDITKLEIKKNWRWV